VSRSVAAPNGLTAEVEWRIKKETAKRLGEALEAASRRGDKLIAAALDPLVLQLHTEASLALAEVPQSLRDNWDAERLKRARE